MIRAAKWPLMGRDRASSEDLNTAVPADAVARWPCLLGGPGVELGGRAGRIGPGCAGRYAQVPQDPRNGARFRDRPDDLAPASAAGTAQDLDQKDPAQQPGPRHSVRRHYWSIRAAVSWRGLFGGGGDHRRTPRRGWGQNSVIADQVGSGDRHQSRQLLHQLQWLKKEGLCSV